MGAKAVVIAVIALVGSVGGCAEPATPDAAPDAGVRAAGDDDTVRTTCLLSGSADVYSPYRDRGAYPTGTVAAIPWRSATSTYPAGDEQFSAYALPSSIECGSTKGDHDYLDVTAGCLDAVAVGSNARGQIEATSEGYFRAVALGHQAGNARAAKWTDESIQYRFYFSEQTGDVSNPGFKAFARYRDEDDLYVASWRADGVVQIQRKSCGIYTYLQIRRDIAPPSARTWHTLRFDAIGDELTLWLDGTQAMTVTDHTFAWGTVGIRIDSFADAYLDDWRVF